MSIEASFYLACGWLLFHWLCYGILAHRLVVSERYKHCGWPRMMIYAGAGPFVSSVMIFPGLKMGGGIGMMIAAAVVIVVSCSIWSRKFTERDPSSAFRYSLPAPSTAIALPFLGPLFVLLWVGLSFGLDEMIGVDRGDRADRREGIVNRMMAFIAIIILITYIMNLLYIEYNAGEIIISS